MNILFDETITSDDGERVSRNIWYGYADMSVDGGCGKIFNLDENFMEILDRTIRSNLSEDIVPHPTETNWYFYGSTVTKDAIGDTIRPTIMIRERVGEFVINFNISDLDFSVNLDNILSFKESLKKRLASR